MVKFIKKELKEYNKLLTETPAWIMTMFVVSVVAMNLFANKSINLPVSWLALDTGMIFAWMPFLSMDILVKMKGAKASIRMTVITTLINIVISVLFFAGGCIPGTWGEAFSGDMTMINTALNNTVKGNWYILFGSTVAFIVAGIVNSLVNEGIGKLVKKDSFASFGIRSYVSTVVGQFVDNLVFSFIVSQVLFGWTLVQCITCAATGAVCELVLEVVFSPLGWKVCNSYKKQEMSVNQ